MPLPVLVTIEDVDVILKYLTPKPTGVPLKEAAKVVDKRHLDGRKLSALESWKLITREGGKMRITERGRQYAAGAKQAVLREILTETAGYRTILEWAHHQQKDCITAAEVAARWHEHSKEEVGEAKDQTLMHNAAVLFELADACGLGSRKRPGRKSVARLDLDSEALGGFVQAGPTLEPLPGEEPPGEQPPPEQPPDRELPRPKAIFIAHGKDKGPLQAIEKVLRQFKVPFLVAEEEPNVGRPISQKVRQTMEQCSAAIVIFTADEELQDLQGNKVLRPSQNVIHELGAASFLYGNKIVILKQEGIELPTNFRDLGYISFVPGQLEAKAVDIIKELIALGFLQVMPA